MTPSLIVDLLVLVALCVALYGGWRAGAFSSILSALGVIAGLICGIALAPVIMGLTEDKTLRFILALVSIIVLSGLGNGIGGMLGNHLRSGMKTKGQALDSICGALFQGLSTILVVWMLTLPLKTTVENSFAEGIEDSYLLSAVDKVAPERLAEVPQDISAMLQDTGWPTISTEWLRNMPNKEVPPPDGTIAASPGVQSARSSVVHVISQAPQCSRRLLGSGMVTAPDYVITNAHVVAGAESVELETVLGMKEAEVVYFNPMTDLAVLHSWGLELPTLPWAADSSASLEDAVVLGYPKSGPFTAEPARIREKLRITGPDIYGAGQGEREVYTIRASVQQGNSGGPLINPDGQALGVIFGASTDTADTGYALTAAEVQAQIGDVTQLVNPVPTGTCVEP